jgi:hypothetical protein
MEETDSQLFASFLLGVFLKIYDDFVDLNITGYPLLIDISKIIIIITTYFLINSHYILGLFIAASLIISNHCKRFDNTFWDAYLYFVAALCVWNYKQIYNLGEHLSVKLGYILFLLLGLLFEETRYAEEMSYNKMTSRSYSILLNTILLAFLEYSGAIDYYGLQFFVILIIFVNSYFATNIIIQKVYASYNPISNRCSSQGEEDVDVDVDTDTFADQRKGCLNNVKEVVTV